MARRDAAQIKRERILMIFGFAFVFIPWGYALVAPDPNFFAGSGLLLIGIMLLAVAATEYLELRKGRTIAIVLVLFGVGDYWLYQRTQGAHIRIERLDVADPIAGSTPFINVAFENSGTAQATIQPHYLSYFVEAPAQESDRLRIEDELADQAKRSFTPNKYNEYTIGARQSGRFTTARPQLDEDEMRKLYATTHLLYYIGTLRYLSSGKEYETTFCAYLQGGSRALFLCNSHNDEHVEVRRQ